MPVLSKVFTAENGQAALDLLDQARPEVILLDLMMPSMNGRVFCESLSEAFRGIPILLLSGSNDIDRAAEELGVAGGLRKPFDLDDLLEAVQRALAG